MLVCGGMGRVGVLGGVRGLGVGGGISCHVMSIVHMSGFFKGVRRMGASQYWGEAGQIGISCHRWLRRRARRASMA